MNKKDKIKLGTIGGGIAAVVGVLANLTSVLSFFEAKFDNNDRVTVESTSKIESVTENEYTSLNDIQDDDSSEENFTETKGVADTNTNTTVSKTVTEEIESYKLPIKNICKIEDFGMYYSEKMCYDEKNKKLYFVEKRWKLCCYDLVSGNISCVKEMVYDENDPNYGTNSISSIYFNDFSQELYMAGRELHDWGLYDVLNDIWLKDIDSYKNITFLDDKTFITTTNDMIYVYSISRDNNNLNLIQTSDTNEYGNSPFGDKFVNYTSNAFVHNELIHYLLTNGNLAAIYCSKQPIPLDLNDSNFNILAIENIKCYHVGDNNVYYITKDNDMYRYDIDSQNDSDIKLIDGDDIQETYSQYISEDIDNFIYVNDKCFIVYDNADETIKLVGTP